MKEILMSLSPYWYYLIGEGIKKIEVRSRIPKDQNWNKKVECYMTKDKKSFNRIPKEFQEKYKAHFGKVGMQFVCDKIDEYTNYSISIQDGWEKRREDILKASCLSIEEWTNYVGDYISDFGYCLHISDLKIYDKPKELGKFDAPCPIENHNCEHCLRYGKPYTWAFNDDTGKIYCTRKLTRPPQSWCYVEELKGGKK